MTSSSIHPTLPPLYFEQKGAPISVTAASNEQDTTPTTTVELPSELLQSMLTSYATWGDLAKLATVQSGWKSLLDDAAAMSPQAKWDLAQSLLNGTNGLQANPSRAIEHLMELAQVPVDKDCLPTKPDNNEHDNNNNNQDNSYSAPAMVEIANCYLDGRGVQAGGSKGIAWMAAAFEFGGDATAAHRLGVIYERDYQLYTGIEVDVYAAAIWFESAAEAGNADAMAELGLCYELGCGKEQSDEKALDWYMRAAEKGNLTAKYSVGEAFEEARGVPQSDEEACLWYYKAAVDGCVDSKLALQRLHDIARIVVPGVGQMFDA